MKGRHEVAQSRVARFQYQNVRAERISKGRRIFDIWGRNRLKPYSVVEGNLRVEIATMQIYGSGRVKDSV